LESQEEGVLKDHVNFARPPWGDHESITDMSLIMFLRRRNLTRIFILLTVPVLFRLILSSSLFQLNDPHEILENNVLDIVTRSGKGLDARKHKFLQVRIGRDERRDIFDDVIRNGALDFWARYQKP
jgi:hypothetical protein